MFNSIVLNMDKRIRVVAIRPNRTKIQADDENIYRGFNLHVSIQKKTVRDTRSEINGDFYRLEAIEVVKAVKVNNFVETGVDEKIQIDNRVNVILLNELIKKDLLGEQKEKVIGVTFEMGNISIIKLNLKVGFLRVLLVLVLVRVEVVVNVFEEARDFLSTKVLVVNIYLDENFTNEILDEKNFHIDMNDFDKETVHLNFEVDIVSI